MYIVKLLDFDIVPYDIIDIVIIGSGLIFKTIRKKWYKCIVFGGTGNKTVQRNIGILADNKDFLNGKVTLSV